MHFLRFILRLLKDGTLPAPPPHTYTCSRQPTPWSECTALYPPPPMRTYTCSRQPTPRSEVKCSGYAAITKFAASPRGSAGGASSGAEKDRCVGAWLRGHCWLLCPCTHAHHLPSPPSSSLCMHTICPHPHRHPSACTPPALTPTLTLLHAHHCLLRLSGQGVRQRGKVMVGRIAL